MGRIAGTMTKYRRRKLQLKLRARWADPEERAELIEAMRLVTADDAAAILEACKAQPPRKYKLIANEFDVSEGTVSGIARAAGIRRQGPRVKPFIRVRPKRAIWKDAA